MPSVVVDGAAASVVSFSPWVSPSASFLESNMTYKGRLGGIEVHWTAYASDGVKLWEGDVQHPSLNAGETGRVSIMNPHMDTTARIVVSVD